MELKNDRACVLAGRRMMLFDNKPVTGAKRVSDAWRKSGPLET